MSKKPGLWIDHRKASVTFITESGEETKLIISNVERQRRRLGGSPLKGAFGRVRFSNDINEKRHFQLDLSVYYDSVIAIETVDFISDNRLKRRIRDFCATHGTARKGASRRR